jgi:nucleoside-diphosphate-sugar epimerase
MIALIGGSGFIGSRLSYRLIKSGKLFQIIDKAPSLFFPEKVFNVDIRRPFSLNFSSPPTTLINLAAEHRDNVSPLSLYDEVNVGGAINVCTFAEINDIKKIIFTSSVAVYGFTKPGTDESGKIAPFNDYGRTKWEAEKVFEAWQAKAPKERTLVIIRPTVVFGERNRGNVFNVLKQIASGKFVMVGNGLNRKSMAYVENVAAFLEYSLEFQPGIHIFNYVDKPDFSMNKLVSHVNKLLGRSTEIKFRIPYHFGLLIGHSLDFIARITGKKFPISSIRVKKFCSNSVYTSAIESTGFTPPVPLMDAIEKTIHFEFINTHNDKRVFFTE